LDGRFVVVGDSGDVIETATRRSVANLEPLYNSRVFLEIDWSNGLPVATSTRSGMGYVTKRRHSGSRLSSDTTPGRESSRVRRPCWSFDICGTSLRWRRS